MDKPLQVNTKQQPSILSFFHPKPEQPTSPVFKHHQEDPEAPQEEEEREDTSSTSPEVASSEQQPPPNAVISAIHEKHIQALKRINTLLLPITYPENFYRTILSPERPANLSFVILWNAPPGPASRPRTSGKVYTVAREAQQVVGGIVCRLERDPARGTSAVYIQSLALLSPYRSQGLAAALLDAVVRAVVRLPRASADPPAPHCLYAHVWTENADALAWYAARGFTVQGPPVPNYYHRLRPSTALIVARNILPSDHVRHNAASATTSTSSRKNSSEDWELVEAPPPPTMAPPSLPPPLLPFVDAAPPTTQPPPQPPSPKPSKKASSNPPAQTYLNFPPAPPPVPSATIPHRPAPLMPPPATHPPPSHAGAPAASFQNRAPASEWNDLPLDILGAAGKSGAARPTTTTTSTDADARGGGALGSRSRSSSRASGKKKRLYPAAAFDGGDATSRAAR